MNDTDFVLDIEGMSCASCITKVERALGGVPGVEAAAVNLATRTAAVHTSTPGLFGDDLTPLIGAVERVGYGAREHRQDRPSAQAETRDYLRRLVVAVTFTIPVLILMLAAPDTGWSGFLMWALTTPVVLYCGWPFLRSAARAARHRTTTMDTLVAIGALAAYTYSVLALVSGMQAHYFDTAAVIVTLVLLGKTLEARARASAGDAARSLLERGAGTATLVEEGLERRVPIEQVRPGQTVVVRPGEKIPADGIVKDGTSWIDLSLLTGESVPVDVGPGDEVVGASINGHGRLLVFVTTVGANTKLAGIVRLLESAQGSKAPVQRLADRISGVFVPAVLAIAVATFAGWFVHDPNAPGAAMLHAVAVLLIACPCALGLATPAAIMAGTGRAAELGVLFKGGEVFEKAHGADTILLDKTGTVTLGSMTLDDVRGVDGYGADRVLSMAAAAESGSEHPIARAVVAAAHERHLEIPDASAATVQPGAGASATVAGVSVVVGRPEDLPEALAVEADRLAASGRTVFAVWLDGTPAGLMTVRDRVKPDAAAAIARMRALGLEVAMVTGDRRTAAESVANTVGIDRVLAEVYPEGKVAEVERLQARGQRVIFAGDGINDAPAITLADVGMAMGSGTDVALAAADVDLLGGSLSSVADALELSRATYRVIEENLFWAFAYNVVMIPLAVVGVLSPALAAAAMALSSVSVVLNALRLRRFGRSHRPATDPSPDV